MDEGSTSIIAYTVKEVLIINCAISYRFIYLEYLTDGTCFLLFFLTFDFTSLGHNDTAQPEVC